MRQPTRLTACLIFTLAWATPVTAGPPESLAGDNLVAGAEALARWSFEAGSDAIRPVTAPDGATGIDFQAAAIPEHLEQRDWAVLPIALNNRPFDLTVDVRIDRLTGPSVFSPGLVIGLAPDRPYDMDDDAVAAMMTFHFGGLYTGVRRGPPYALQGRATDVLVPSVSRLVEGRIPAAPYSPSARGAFGTDTPIRLRIRRDANAVLSFTAWVPAAGESSASPWWHGEWPIPDAHADMPFRYLFLQRVPVFAVHLGQGNRGYGDAIQIAGRITGMRLRLDPPAINAVDWTGHLLAPGDSLTIRGSGLSPEAVVTIGGLDAAILSRPAPDTLTVRLPGVAPGQRYDVAVIHPDGATATATQAAPVGALLESLSLSDSLPEGGDRVTLRGSGFRGPGPEATIVRFGDTPAELIESPDPRTLHVRVPAGAPGSVRVTATTTGGTPFAGSLTFGYTPRPSLFFSADDLSSLRTQTAHPPLDRYRDALMRGADTALARPPYGHHMQVGPYLAGLPWIAALSADESHRATLLRWVAAVLDRPESDSQEAAFLALAYDVAGIAMPPSQRESLLRRLTTVLAAYRTDTEAGNWHITTHSWPNPRANAAAIRIALALRHADPAASAAVIATARHHLLAYVETAIGPDGGWIDGVSWGSDALADLLEAGLLLARHHDDRTLLEHPRLDRIDRFYRSIILTPSRLARFGDTHDPYNGIVPSAAVGARAGSPLLLWMADTISERANWSNAGRLGPAMLLRGDSPPPDPPPLPLVSALDDIHWGVLRSEPAHDAAYAVAISGRAGVLPYHRQHDAGSFQLYAHSTEVVVDPGWGSGAAAEHSLPEIDGHTGDPWGARIITSLAQGPWRFMVVDATDSFAPRGVRRFHRTLALHATGTLIVIDDLQPSPDQPGEVRSRFQFPVVDLHPTLAAATVSAGESASLAVRFFGPSATLATEDRQRGRHWEGDWQTLRADYIAQPDGPPLVSVMRMSEGADPPHLPEPVTIEPDAIVITVGDGDTLRVTRGDGGWTISQPATGTPLVNATLAWVRPTARAGRVETPPTIDGNLDDPAWQAATPIRRFSTLHTWREPPRAQADTDARFAWDDTHLYAAIRCIEPELEALVVSDRGPALGAGGDHVILYLDPEREHMGNRYYGVVLTAGGRHLGPYGKSGDIGGLDIQLATGREPPNGDTPGAWTLEVAIPWETLLQDPWERLTLTGAPDRGHRMGLNIQRYRMPAQPEVSVWAPGFDAPATAPWRWGDLVFE